MTNALLVAIACILLLGFMGILTVLTEIRDKMRETNGHVEKLKDEIVDDDPVVFHPPDERDYPFGAKPPERLQ